VCPFFFLPSHRFLFSCELNLILSLLEKLTSYKRKPSFSPFSPSPSSLAPDTGSCLFSPNRPQQKTVLGLQDIHPLLCLPPKGLKPKRPCEKADPAKHAASQSAKTRYSVTIFIGDVTASSLDYMNWGGGQENKLHSRK